MILYGTKSLGPVHYEVRGFTVVAIDPTYGSIHDQNDDGRHPRSDLYPRTRGGLRALIRDMRAHGYEVRS
jgi:hypothetical protein